MQSIIFFTLSILAMVVVLYLGVTSIMKGFSAKQDRRLEKEAEENEQIEVATSEASSNLSSEIEKLNELYKTGALSKDEFDKAKAKLLET